MVGSRVAALLAADYPDRVVVAGRHLERARVAAAESGHGARPQRLDVTVPSSITAALDDAAVIVSCIDQPQRALLGAATERGLRYTDITPHLMELGRGSAYARVDEAARASGARILLGAGLVPGISSVMVRAVADALGGAERIETALLLSARETSGPASLNYFLKELDMPFAVHVNGRDRPARAFSDPHTVEFPPPTGHRAAYLFPFSDQVLYPLTMDARTVVSRLALEPAPLCRALGALVRIGAGRVIAAEGMRGMLVRRRSKRAPVHAAPFALRVDVSYAGRSGHATLAGHGQADATAAGAAGLAHSLLAGEVDEPGAWMPEQVIDPRAFFAGLARRGLIVALHGPAQLQTD